MYPSRALKFWLDQLRKHNRLVLGRRRRRSSRVRVWNGIKIKYKDILRERERELDPSQRLTNHLAIRANWQVFSSSSSSPLSHSLFVGNDYLSAFLRLELLFYAAIIALSPKRLMANVENECVCDGLNATAEHLKEVGRRKNNRPTTT